MLLPPNLCAAGLAHPAIPDPHALLAAAAQEVQRQMGDKYWARAKCGPALDERLAEQRLQHRLKEQRQEAHRGPGGQGAGAT